MNSSSNKRILRCPNVSWGDTKQHITGGFIGSKRIALLPGIKDKCVLANRHSVALFTLGAPQEHTKLFPDAKDLGDKLGDTLRPLPCDYTVAPLHTDVHRYEIIHVESSPKDAVIASVDTAGTAILARIPSLSSPLEGITTAAVAPPSACTEMGLASLAWSPEGTSLARTRHFEHSLDIIDAETQKVVRHFHTVECPSQAVYAALKKGESRNLVAVAEGSSICIYDPRVKQGDSKPVMINRIDTFLHHKIRAIDWCEREGVVLFGGDDRGIQAVSLGGGGGPAGRWAGCTKLSVASVTASMCNESTFCYVSGSDSELVAGSWGAKRPRTPSNNGSLKVDSRWVGLRAMYVPEEQTETLWGLTAQSSVYVIPSADTLLRTVPETNDEE